MSSATLVLQAQRQYTRFSLLTNKLQDTTEKSTALYTKKGPANFLLERPREKYSRLADHTVLRLLNSAKSNHR